jgi:hypothetical protein
MHKILNKLKIATFPLFYFSTNPGLNSAGAGLATANRIAPFHLLIYFRRLHSFQVRLDTINRVCDRFGRQARATPFS